MKKTEAPLKIKTVRQTFRLTGITPILGSTPADFESYSYLVENMRKTNPMAADLMEADRDLMPTREDIGMDEEDNSPVTGFQRDRESKEIILHQQIKGFFKNAGKVLGKQFGYTQYRAKVDDFMSINPVNVKITRDGKPLMQADRLFKRSLRASTARGDRIALATSELIEAGWQAEFTVVLIKNEATDKSRALNMEMVRALLEYGQFVGLGQWRNGDYGRFTWEAVSEEIEN